MITKQIILKDIKDRDEESHNNKHLSWLKTYQNKKELLEELNK